jgi:hypothetical protein
MYGGGSEANLEGVVRDKTGRRGGEAPKVRGVQARVKARQAGEVEPRSERTKTDIRGNLLVLGEVRRSPLLRAGKGCRWGKCASPVKAGGGTNRGERRKRYLGALMGHIQG